MKIKLSIVLVVLGVCILLMWLSGSHGHLQFRSYMIEDWVVSCILLVCFGLPLVFLITWMARLVKHKKGIS